jgi:endonuclease YncB( thermonuclease family)
LIRLRRLVRPSPLAVVLLAISCAEEPPAAEVERPRAVVQFVADGDSLELRDGRRVRLLQIDAPERGECHHDASGRALDRLAAPGQAVQLETDPLLDERDEHERLLRYVHVRGRNVNLALVAQGDAAPYLFRNERGRYAGALLRAAEAARADRRGFWGMCPHARLEPGLGAVTGPRRRR